jgi:hypothetical protein
MNASQHTHALMHRCDRSHLNCDRAHSGRRVSDLLIGHFSHFPHHFSPLHHEYICMPILHPTSPDTLTLQNLHKFSNSFVFDNYNLLIQIVAVLCVGFLYFAGSGENFGVNLHYLVSELHTIRLTEVLTNTIWGNNREQPHSLAEDVKLSAHGRHPTTYHFYFSCLFILF